MKKLGPNDGKDSKKQGSLKNYQKKDVVVSILLSESTTSELKLNLPSVENLVGKSSISASLSKSSTYDLNTLFASEIIKEIPSAECGKVKSEVAYFAPDIKLEESWSSLELGHVDGDSVCSHDSNNKSSDEKLKPVKIYTRPLLTVRSAAHHSNIQSLRNNLFVTVVNSKDNGSNSDWINVCRICHGGESIGDLLSPCQCRGSIALTHIQCLERWLKESATSHCELCQYHYTIVRQPKYGVLKSIFVFIRHPGDRLCEMVCDFIGFILYTSATIISTYTLSVICESISKTSTNARYISSQIMGFTAVLGIKHRCGFVFLRSGKNLVGIAIIDFTYTSWLLNNLEKHTIAWQTWYRNNCDLKVVLPDDKQPIKIRQEDSIVTDQD